MKPLLLGGVLLLAGAGTAGALYLATLGGEEEGEEVVTQLETATLPPTPMAPLLTTGPGVTQWRWMDVTVLIPDSSGIQAGLDTAYFDNGSESRPALRVVKQDDLFNSDVYSYALIDAQDGRILRSEMLEQHRAEMDQVLGTVALSEFDPAKAPWPYNGDPLPPSATLSPSIRPDPGSGMYGSVTTGSSGSRGTSPPWVECEFVFEGITVRNGRSHASVGLDPVSGAVCKNLSNVQPEDLSAFERFLDRAALCDLQRAEC